MSRDISPPPFIGPSGVVTVFGKDALVPEEPGDVVTDLYGLETCTSVYKCPADRLDLVPALFSAHPYFTYLHIERLRKRWQDGFLIITADYAGVNGTSASIFELSVGVQDDPIVQHPKFVGSIGGTPSNPLNGAVFLGPDGRISTDDATGQFAYFPVDSDFAGIDSYLAADYVTWRQRFVTDSLIFYNNVGFIDTPNGSPPAGTSNWILLSVNIEQRGICFFVTAEWRAGGRRGWNTTIYTH